MATSASPTSSLLQDMLREKKAQTQRVKKSYDPANGQKDGLEGRDIQGSPIASRSDAQSRRGSGVGVRNVTMPKGMGFKEMEEYISKINKQNFDLKLEVFHRRQRNEVLETKLEKFQELEADNEELQSINEELLLELEKRDVAIQEAVGLICELEAKNEEMQMAVVKMDFTQSSSTSDPEPVKEGNGVMASSLSTISGMGQSGPSYPTNHGIKTDLQAPSEHSLSAPDTLSPPKLRSTRRVPSFMREAKKSTNVLRSLYSHDGNASFISLARPGSVFSGEDDSDDDDVDRQMTNSPRLSILSESGFASIYGGRKDQISGGTEDQNDVAEPPLPKMLSKSPQRDTQRQTRLYKWLDERNMPRTPSPKPFANDKISSIGAILSEVQTSAETTPAGQQRREQRTPDKRQTKQARSLGNRSASPTFGGPIFGAAILPPTPDTMSTATLDANSSSPSIITEKSLLDGMPFPAKGYSPLTSDIRPHTSDSTNGSPSPGLSRDLVQQDMSARNSARGISVSDTPARPSLTFHGTDTFNGESLSPTQGSRTLSYPSPTSRPRRLSDQRSPTSCRGSDSNSERTLNQSPQKRPSSGNAGTIMPSRHTARDDHQSPLSSQDVVAPSPIAALPHLATSAQPQRSSSFRSSIANKFKFNRSINNASRIPNPSSNPQNSSPSRPPITRAPATTQHARLPRPASLYVQALPGTSSSEEIASEKNDAWMYSRRHSAALDRVWDKAGENEIDGGQRGGSALRPTLSRSATSTKIKQGFSWNR